ncbi:Alcohol dehydrogenase GroES-like protein [Macrophomina phaseolina MS6]|uniref:Alcohol dehydrogenase GroES-like protein n=1 Tax=Macrophomina phaseolina (strain MS6) TaxID=1126212 RepID=K2RP25_MACPH|nr:Alcohol dehydrogenase GroES-like protein [Macrophomina phaseolina MS6]
MQSLSEALESTPLLVASLSTSKPSSRPACASSDPAAALSPPVEVSRAVDNTLSASPMGNSWSLEGENSHQQWNGPLHYDAGSIDAISGQTNSSMLPCSEPLLSWQPLDFDWNIDIPAFTDKITPPGSPEPPSSPSTRLIGVSQDRFMKAHQAWGARFKGRPGDASIWRRIADSPGCTMFWASDCKSTISHSRRVNKPCRDQLSRTFNNTLATTHLSNDNASGHPHVEFPSAETLEYALEQYFVYFHASLPFIHIPTFSAESAPTSLLLAMCLLGLIMLPNGSSSEFLHSAFEALARIITVDLTSMSLIKERNESHLTLMAASLLLLQIAALLEVSCALIFLCRYETNCRLKHDGRVTQTSTLRTIVLSVGVTNWFHLLGLTTFLGSRIPRPTLS